MKRSLIKNDSGGVSQFALITVLAIIVISAGIFILLGGMQSVTIKEKKRLDISVQFHEQAKTIISEYTGDKTPEADSFYDLYDRGYSYNNTEDNFIKEQDGFKITITEHSGRLNVNTMHPNLITNTDIKLLFSGIVDESYFKNYRSDLGLTLDLEDYSELFASEEERRFFTVYGYANINVTYEHIFPLIAEARTENSTVGESILALAQQYRSELEMFSKAQFKSNISTRYPEVYPIINIEPAQNINFLPEKLIRAFCAYPYGTKKIENHETIAGNLISIRNSREILPDELETLIPVQTDIQKRIFQYFGTVTWFWEILIEKENNSLEIVLSRIPSEDEVFGEVVFLGVSFELNTDK